MKYRSSLALVTLLAPLSAASANQINTGSEAGAYHSTFCPALEAQLGRSKFEHKCTTSDGTADNMSRVAADPRQIGYGQLDIFALEAPALGGAKTFTRLRGDDVRECVFHEFLDGVALAGRNDVVARLILLEHQPHGADVVAGKPPIAA